MAGFPYNNKWRSDVWPRRNPLFVVLIALVCLTVFYAAGGRHFHRFERAPAAPRAPLVGHAWIVDGDSIRIDGVAIRLEGIDAPEWDQTCTDQDGRTWACGRAATRQLKAYTRDQTLTCRPRAIDRYGRVVATCLLPDGADVNARLVRDGWAVVYDFGRTYAAEESEAKAARRGIWSGSFIYPSEWRRQKGQHGWRR